MDTIDHPLTSMHAARQYEEESSRNRSSSSSPLPLLPSNRSRNNSNSSLSSSCASPPSLADTLDSSMASASSSLPLSETLTRPPATAAATGAPLESVGSDLSQLSVPLARISTSDRRWLEDFINKDDDEEAGDGVGEDHVNPCLRSRQYSALDADLNSRNNLHYISDTEDDDDDNDAEDSPAIIVDDISRHDHSAKHQGHREQHHQLFLEKEQEVARMTAQLSSQCDLYERKISSAPPSGTSASTSIRSSVVPRPRSRQSPSNGSPDIQTMTNTVRIHVYDLLAKDAEMELFSWGCHVPIGRCFVAMNDGLHALGSGAYHVGVEVNGLEFAYGANDVPSLTGVFTCRPRRSPGYQYRTTLDFGSCSIIGAPGRSQGSRASPPDDTPGNSTASDGHRIMQDMAREYLGCDYDLLRRNCCTFARDACLRLGVAEDEIPSWFLHLASAGADAHDAVTNVEAAVDRGVEPLKRILSLENSASIGGRRRERPERSARKDSDKEERENTSGCGKMRDGSAIDSVVDAIGRSLCFGPQMLTDSCAT